jgi:hypothetical protein
MKGMARSDRWRLGRATALLVLLAVSFAVAHATPARADAPVYGDALANPWQDWSWGGITNDFSHTTPVHGGARSLAVTYTGAWSGLQLGRVDLLDLTGTDTFRFYIYGGSSGGQQIEIEFGDNQSGAAVRQSVTPTAGTWTRVDVPIWSLGAPLQVNYIYWFNNTAGAQATFYLDDIAFVATGAATPTAIPPGVGPALSVDGASGRHAISPLIYGMNFADEALASELRLPVRRWGGNSTTRYNWQTDTTTRAGDWYFENIPEDNTNSAALPDGSSSDQFVEQDRRTGTATIMTITLIGWTPKARARACGFSVARYGAQQSTDPWAGDCGNGVRANGTEITGNDPTDTSSAITPAFVQTWITHLSGKYGSAAAGGVRFYNLDNEPMLWPDTHRDVHPAPTSYDEMRDRTYAYAAAVKAIDPAAQTLGPVVWGWTAYFWSALDWSAGGAWWDSPQDRLAHGNVPFVEWYLQQMRTYEQAHGVRILDYLDVHNYPQAAGVTLSPAGDAATQALRLRSTRSLWDSTYVDESWIGEAVNLIPRMHQWIDANYPGTQLAVTEYNWGALDHINGALAQADVLGIFGREGLDLATLWDPPSASQPGAFAFRMFRNYDGAGGEFGDVELQARSADQERLAIYAAQRSGDGALTTMVINKTNQSLTDDVALANLATGARAEAYRYSSANLNAIERLADLPVVAGDISATFAPNSITLLVVASDVTPIPPAATSTPTPTRTPTGPPTATTTRAPSQTATATATRVPSRTPTRTVTRRPTITPTKTVTRRPTPTRTATRRPTRTPTRTVTRTRASTTTPTSTRRPTRTATPR